MLFSLIRVSSVSFRSVPVFSNAHGNVYYKIFNVNCSNIRNGGFFKDGYFCPVYEYEGIANVYIFVIEIQKENLK